MFQYIKRRASAAGEGNWVDWTVQCSHGGIQYGGSDDDLGECGEPAILALAIAYHQRMHGCQCLDGIRPITLDAARPPRAEQAEQA